MSNRVEELESTVRELQAAVDGLTEELVETRERLRQLEEASNTPDRNESAGTEASGRTESPPDAHAERVDADGGVDESADEPSAPDETGAAEPPTDAAESSDGGSAEADPAADAGSESDSGSDDDEIIVA